MASQIYLNPDICLRSHQVFARKSDGESATLAFNELCNYFDPDHDGKITFDEMSEGLRNLGHHFIAHDAPIQGELNQYIRAQVATFVQHDPALQASVQAIVAAKAAGAKAGADARRAGGGGCGAFLVRMLLFSLVVAGAWLAYRCAAVKIATGHWPDDVAALAALELQKLAVTVQGLVAEATSGGAEEGKGEL